MNPIRKQYYYIYASGILLVAALVSFPNSLQAQNKFFATPNRGGVEGARGNAQIQMLIDQSTRMHACTAQGHLYAPSNSASDANGCLAQITIDGSNGNFTAQGLGTFSGGLTVNGATTLNGAILNGGNTIRDSGGGWVRTYGDTGWYSQTHGGGFHMTDTTWVRVYGGKWLYSATGIRADGGGVRTNQICDVNGGNCIAQSALGGGVGGIQLYLCPYDLTHGSGPWSTWGCLGQVSTVNFCRNYTYSNQWVTRTCNPL